MLTIPELKEITYEIRTARQKHKIKSSELARASKISPSAMSKLENDRLKPSYNMVYGVLDALNKLIVAKGTPKSVSLKMIRNVISVSPVDTISRAREIMKKNDISQLPIVDRDGRITGLVTEKSILDNPDAVTCDEAIEFSYAIVGPDEDLEKARQVVRNVQAILVVKDGRLFGILTKSDFL
ncbi:putative transcriptional regulator with C-terminal CBS domains [Candidatus Mancarchaeum acidiphilum]|uniref:Putative transcriptional regulator with C-terminal CBS domains n=1 Tax=Candidatus Mancarchaeum acidiphilum TaxID=1920749 RepID=A0A218NMF8_9ARCH|nr:CBS domain-containing protein [Candidatus Mancarchaeum acidiphilum]ASI13647.1 putative transcriptional regulator with C-terminal CBS domains [Candidatus Mancarchaeum acidiphilum]